MKNILEEINNDKVHNIYITSRQDITVPQGNTKDLFVARIDGTLLTDEGAALKLIGEAFEFPDYYGQNFSAFDECIVDLDWIDAKEYLLVIDHADLIGLDALSFSIFFSILDDEGTEWKKGRGGRNLIVGSPPIPPTQFNCILVVDAGNERSLLKRFKSATRKIDPVILKG